MTESTFPIAVVADQVPPRARKSLYPQAILDVQAAGWKAGRSGG
ncbi:hypothetical protein [Methylomonas sp. Kb3]|nr:hypothetical protein [Methylomonas sp. Kb3]